MKCQQARMYMSPYLDSELDPTTTYEVSRHLGGCSTCARLFAAEEQLEAAISEHLSRPQGDEEPVVERALSRAFAPRSLLSGWRALFSAAAVLLVLGLVTYRFSVREAARVPELVAMAAEDHRRYVLGEITPELLSDDPAALAAFLQGHLAGETGSFPTGNGWEVEGARVCRFRGVSVGFVTLRYHGIPVSVVDVPDEVAALVTQLPPGERCFELPGGRGVLRRTPSGLRVAFGDVAMGKLQEVLSATP